MTNYCPETGMMPSSPPFACPVSGHKWHKAKGIERNKCTNDLEYPSAWNDPAVANNFLFDTFVECCAKYASVAERFCTAVDICETRATVIDSGQLSELLAELLVVDSSPTVVSPATLSTVRPTVAVGCGRNTPRKCVKDSECSWDRTTKSCVDFVPVEADEEHVDETVGVELDEKVGNRVDADKHADEHVDDCGKKYHPTSVTERKCTNDDVYPSIWDRPDMTRVYFFTSSAECCAFFYNDGHCTVVNICSATN